MEHDQKICPRCGEPAGDYSFCHTCRAHLDSLNGTPGHAGTATSDAGYPATQALREILRLEQALAAASKGISDRIAARSSGAAVEVDRDPRPADTLAASGATLDIVETPTAHDVLMSDLVVQPVRDIARLEEVLKVVPADKVELTAEVVSPASDAVELPADELVSAPVEEPTEKHDIAPTYVAAHALREAFWFEQAAAFKSHGQITRRPPEPEVRAVEPQHRATNADTRPTDPASSVAPPNLEAAAQPSAHDDASPSAGWVWMGHTSRNNFVAALCLLTLIGVVLMLIRRHPAAKAS